MSVFEKPVSLLFGPAGTGKTFQALHFCLSQLASGTFYRCLWTRPNVTMDNEDIGYLPGDLVAKSMPWMQSYIDNITVMANHDSLIRSLIWGGFDEGRVDRSHVESWISKELSSGGSIEWAPLAFLRGRSLHHTIIVADEMQNATKEQWQGLLTRIGTNSKIIITSGEPSQSDIPIHLNGSIDFLRKCSSLPHPPDWLDVFRFTDKDIIRSPTVRKILSFYNQ